MSEKDEIINLIKACKIQNFPYSMFKEFTARCHTALNDLENGDYFINYARVLNSFPPYESPENFNSLKELTHNKIHLIENTSTYNKHVSKDTFIKVVDCLFYFRDNFEFDQHFIDVQDRLLDELREEVDLDQ